KSNATLLTEITDKLGRIKHQAQKQNIAALLFGGNGKEMATMLSEGMAPIQQLFAQTRQGKWLMGDDTAQYAAELSNKLDAFKEKISNIGTFIGARFMPVINALIECFSSLIDENRDLIQITVTQWAEALTQTIQDLCNPASDLRKGMSDIIEKTQHWFKWLEPLIGKITLFKAALIALGVGIFGPLIASIASLGASIVGLAVVLIGPLISALVTVGSTIFSVGAAIMTTPIGWILAGIAALVGAGYLLYKNWDTVVNYIKSMWNSVCNFFNNTFDNLVTIFKEFSPLYWIAQKIGELVDWLSTVNLTEIGTNLMNGLWEGLKSAWTSVANWFNGIIDTLTGLIPGWGKKKLELNATISHTSTQSLQPFTTQTNARTKRIINTIAVTNLPSEQRNTIWPTKTGIAQPGESAFNGSRESFKTPEPLMAYKPTEVNAPITITNLNISGGNGSPQDIHAAINQALERHAKQQRLAIASSLSD
ncbi:phage tail protein, partial [Bartonella raoultii]|uniref:phage tail protein n=1 Tax=Bartonella raoultii TaxID=1457020 RepID=UPI001ABAF40B